MHSYLSKEQRESYLRELFYSSFSDRRASVAVRNEEVRSLAKHLRKLYSLVEIGKGLSPDAESALKEIIKFRTKGRPGFYEAKMMADYKKLLFFRGQREEMERSIQEQQCFQCIHKKKKPLAVLREDDWYWGTKQQLRCGEIIADTLGGLDPAFGVLLHPAGLYCNKTFLFIVLHLLIDSATPPFPLRLFPPRSRKVSACIKVLTITCNFHTFQARKNHEILGTFS